ncbi:uncharacterized protein LOC126810747 [Patella vulgata]|uniref:uncharacterized protein LOC126810747 n=1 Tax=Patella vulgata TaxID=6465 RepID=UPI0024A92F1C|nr:uncharacterized protein LOC126810747 [Patella vulgata]
MLSRLSRLTLGVSLVLLLVGGVYCEVVEGCYGPPEPCLERTLSCEDGNVVIINTERATIVYGSKRNTCRRSQEEQCNSTCCMYESGDRIRSILGRERLSVYQNCTNQRSCNLTPFYQPNTGYEFVSYKYLCLKENAVHNLLNLTAQSMTNESFIYYSGEDQPLDNSCSCQISNIQIEDTLVVYYRLLSFETCSKIRIFPQDERLLNCSTYNENFQEPVNMTGGSRLQFKDLVFKRQEFFLFKLTVSQGSRDISCVCTGPPVINSSEFEYTGLMIGLIVAALMIIVGVVLFCYWRKRTEQADDVTVNNR